MNRYFYAPGMMYPYWVVSEEKDWPKEGDLTKVAMNSAADTDMGDLYGDEFEKFFPRAFEISEEQYHGQTISPRDGLRWSYLVRLMEKATP